MENVRRITKIKLAVMLSSMTLPLIIIIVMALIPFDFSGDDRFSIFDRFQPLPYIIMVLVEGWLAYKNYRYIKILRDDDYAKYYMIKKNDERNKMIRLYTNALVHKIFIYILGVALIFTAFIDEGYFYLTLGVSLAFAIVHVDVFIYYSKKY